MAYVKTRDGTKLYVKDWGDGDPVILIHGWPLDADMWEYQATPLAEAGHRVIAYDRRGFGRSGQPFDGYDYDTLADDLKTVIGETGAKDAAIVGFSMGGGKVARYLSRHDGKHISKAALISSVAPFMLKTPDNPGGVDRDVFGEIKSGLRKDRPAFLAGFGKDFYGVTDDNQAVSEEFLQWSASVCMLASPKATLDCVDAFGFTDFREDMKAFTMPTLIVHGTADKTVPIDTAGRAAKKLIPDAEFKEYEGAPHGLFATHAERLNKDLLAFLKG